MRFWIVVFVFAVSVRSVNTLSCQCNVVPPYSVHHQYCGSNFMIGARIMSGLNIPDDQNAKPYYKIRIQRRFKVPDGVRLPRCNKVFLDVGFATCDMIDQLKRRSVYLLAGQMKDGTLYLGGCYTFYAQYKLESKYRTLVRNPPTCPAPLLRG